VWLHVAVTVALLCTALCCQRSPEATTLPILPAHARALMHADQPAAVVNARKAKAAMVQSEHRAKARWPA